MPRITACNFAALIRPTDNRRLLQRFRSRVTHFAAPSSRSTDAFASNVELLLVTSVWSVFSYRYRSAHTRTFASARGRPASVVRAATAPGFQWSPGNPAALSRVFALTSLKSPNARSLFILTDVNRHPTCGTARWRSSRFADRKFGLRSSQFCGHLYCSIWRRKLRLSLLMGISSHMHRNTNWCLIRDGAGVIAGGIRGCAGGNCSQRIQVYINRSPFRADNVTTPFHRTSGSKTSHRKPRTMLTFLGVIARA